jgi:predicted nuclease of predicted toxin-antitoxin system
MKCVFDENMPIKLCRALNYLEGEHGIQVKHMTEIVSPSTSDIEWMSILGKDRNCFVITKDSGITRNPVEIMAWKESKLIIVFLKDSWFNLDFWTMTWKFIKIWPILKNKIDRNNARTKRIV